MTQSGDPYDNALAERMNRIIKEEFLENRAFKSHQEAYRAIEQAIQIYNSQYPHGSLDYKTPNEVHVMKPQQALFLKKRWVNPNKNKQQQQQQQQQQQNTQKQIANVQSARSY